MSPRELQHDSLGEEQEQQKTLKREGEAVEGKPDFPVSWKSSEESMGMAQQLWINAADGLGRRSEG